MFRSTARDNKAAVNAANTQERKDNQLFTQKELRALQGEALTGYSNYGGMEGVTDPSAGKINYAQFGGERYQGQSESGGTNQKLWKKVQNELGIRSVDKPEDLARMFNYVNGTSSGYSNKGKGQQGGQSELADRTSGEFKDIKGALNEDANAGIAAATALDNTVPAAGNNDYMDIINTLLTQPGNVAPKAVDNSAMLKAGLDAQIDALKTQNSTALEAQAAASAAELSAMNNLFGQQIAGVNQQMLLQQQDFENAQAFTQQQLEAANAAFLKEQQRSANLGNAYIPQSNPNAMSIGYGDGRVSGRKQKNNQLSDLSLISGLGTQKNPLAGLQLA